MSMNRLLSETSPYLLQHKNNPVHWRPWGDDVLADARRYNKPILLSVGYAACHWCHVMAHESFENIDIADLMNDLFINVKVDREERPDIDTIYQLALALLGEQGGWPLTMFLAADGSPFWGGTYFPPRPRYGRPGFPDVLRTVAEIYREDPKRVHQNVTAIRNGLSRISIPLAGPGLNFDIVEETAADAVRLIDPILGGTQGAPKFPQPLFFRFLWRAYKRTGNDAYREAVLTTLTRMCQGGIYDHVGGGFARYATDEHWLIPHFEKMLYDNALLIDLLTEVWLDTHDPLFEQRIRETIDWIVSDLKASDASDTDHAFAAAFDADSEGVEGKFYVWSEIEIDALLAEDAATFKAVYDVTPTGNWEGATILNREHSAKLLSDVEEKAFQRNLQVLLAARRRRVPPLRDDKVLADWNGLTISAMARAAAVFDEPKWVHKAESAFTFIARHLDDDGRLFHSWCAGSARHPAVIDDYAAMALAALALFETTGRRDYIDRAERWVAIADRHYWDAVDGGYFLSADDTRDVIVRAKTMTDHATPSGNTTMLEVLARLSHLTGDPTYRDRCDILIKLFSSNKPQYLVSQPGLLTNFELLERAVQIVIIGEADNDQTIALKRAAFRAAEPLKIVSVFSPNDALPPSHPAHAKGQVADEATAYVCVESRCGLPVSTPEALSEQLTRQ
ncbi:MAG: thioredoxin domain-containing protein [Rhodospirillales bacterium]|nr:thioredoxin domain-containing protein [Rhodospirillales bacterium]